MKSKILFLLTAVAWITSVHAQCDKEISTNPVNSINSEFLPLKNDWFPSQDPSVNAYTVNSFLNSNSGMNWSPGTSIQLDLTAGWTYPFGVASSYIMRNPFSNAHEENHLNSGIGIPSTQNDRDFRWEDGWELLWMNIGKYPNGDPYNAPSQGTYFAHGNQPPSSYDEPILDAIAPPNVPYFVLYNRYRGTLRLFANVWQGIGSNTGPQEWSVTMKYTPNSFFAEKISGLFRYASSTDLALDQPTSHTQIIGPRVQSINQSDWVVAEFPMAFDPCICMKNYDSSKDPGKIEFLFESIETTDIDLYSRSIEIESAIDESNLNEDFLNLSEIDPNEYHPGTATYARMNDLFNKYQAELEKYNNDLEDYNNTWNSTKYQLLDIAKNFVTSGVSLVIPAGNLFTEILDKDAFNGTDDANTITNDAIKGLVGSGVDFASLEIFGKKPDKPTKPTAPTASFTETKYKGTLTKSYYQNTTPLLIPGGINEKFDPSIFDSSLPPVPVAIGYGVTEIYPSIFPAYNKLLGTSALLRTPETKFHLNSRVFQNTLHYSDIPGEQCDVSKEIVGITDFKLKLDDINVALNQTLDFDMEKTKTYVRIEVQMRIKVPSVNTWPPIAEYPGVYDFTTEISLSNFHLSHEFPIGNDGTRRTYSSKWVPLDQVNQYIFSLSIKDNAFYSGTDLYVQQNCDIGDPFFPSLIEPEIESVKMKILQDNYFQQIGHFEEQVNTTQITSYFLFNAEENINHLGEQGNWNAPQPGVFDQYLPGLITIGNVVISASHPLVHEIIGNEIFINAQEVQITGPIQVESGYTLVVQALEKIHSLPGATLNPKVHLRIKKDFYDTPVFEYADNATVYNFCNNNSAYQANTASAALRRRIEEAIAAQELDELSKSKAAPETSLLLYPNPARTELTIQTNGAGIDRLTIFDTATRPVLQASPGGQTLHRMDIGGLAPGVYIARAECGGEVLTEKLVVAK